MAEKILCKVAYNGIDKENWVENMGGDSLLQRVRLERSTFFDIKVLEKSGRDLKADLKKSGMKSAPDEFVKLENIEY